mmetsp:Transcript_94465/g.211776  ORF Transcript_94465/g.211776 Transcript_94465/m.211776 type:complete len:223 (+) Transcript_94465:407-1075(+)
MSASSFSKAPAISGTPVATSTLSTSPSWMATPPIPLSPLQDADPQPLCMPSRTRGRMRWIWALVHRPSHLHRQAQVDLLTAHRTDGRGEQGLVKMQSAGSASRVYARRASGSGCSRTARVHFASAALGPGGSRRSNRTRSTSACARSAGMSPSSWCLAKVSSWTQRRRPGRSRNTSTRCRWCLVRLSTTDAASAPLAQAAFTRTSTRTARDTIQLQSARWSA